jgi:hypothetical protein
LLLLLLLVMKLEDVKLQLTVPSRTLRRQALYSLCMVAMLCTAAVLAAGPQSCMACCQLHYGTEADCGYLLCSPSKHEQHGIYHVGLATAIWAHHRREALHSKHGL